MTQLIHIAAIEHMSGMDLFAAASEIELNFKVAEYCRSNWGTCRHKHIETPPELDANTIELYFDDHENDSLTTDVDSMEMPKSLRELAADPNAIEGEVLGGKLWRMAVANGESTLGYWEWVESHLENLEEPAPC